MTNRTTRQPTFRRPPWERWSTVVGGLTGLLLALLVMPASAQTPSAEVTAWVRLYADAIPDEAHQLPPDSPLDVGVLGNLIYITRFSAGVVQPVNPIGDPAGALTLHEFRFRKRVGGASPALFEALANNGPIIAEFVFYGPNTHGASTHFYTISTTYGLIKEIRLAFGDDGYLVEEITIVTDGNSTWQHEIDPATAVTQPAGP